MNAYQEKWISMLKNANLPGWEITPEGEDILVVMPHIDDLKIIRDNLPTTLAALSLDITEPKERVKFTFRNNHENFDYILNPTEEDRSTDRE
jgi:hypothetical protein